MGAHLVTGYAGKEHITAADQGLYNAGTLGTGKYVLPIGSMFEASIITNNLVKIKDGCLVNQGRNINIAVNDYEECEIDNGIQALKRNDLIVIRYEKNADTGIETASTIVIKGVSGETAVDPEYTKGNIFNGDNVDDFPLYRVKLDGLNITAVEPLFNTIVSFKTLADTVASLNKGLTNLNTNLDGKAPKSHASTGTGYGVGSGSNYGHCKTINNLTASKYVNGESLSAYQGAVLKSYIDVMCGGDGNTGQTGEALRLLGKSSANCVYGNYNFGIYFVEGSEVGLPLTGYTGFLITLRWTTSRIVKILFLVNAYTYIMSQENDGTVVSSWTRL